MDEFLDIRGRQIVRAGEPLRLRGTNLGNWMLLEAYMMGLPSVEYHMRAALRSALGDERFHAFFDTFMDASLRAADIAFLKACGFTMLQVPFNYRHFLQDGTTGGFDRDEGYAHIDRLIELCRGQGMYLLLSCHAAPGCIARDWNAESICGEVYFWDHPHFQEQTADMWRAIATRYRDEPVVMGYELINEPVADDVDVFHQVNMKLLRAIREVDQRHIVVVNANMWGQRIDSLRDELFADARVMPSTHAYPTTKDPFKSLQDFPGTFEGKPVGLEQVREFMVPRADEERIERPLLIGEFGTPLGYPARTGLLDGMLTVFEERGWHWNSWDYKDLGVLGMVSPKPDTSWAEFVNSAAVKRIRQAYGKPAAALSAQLGEALPELTADDLFLLTHQSRHHYDRLALPLVVKLLADRTAGDLRAMAESYAFENCAVDEERRRVLVKHTGAK